MTLPRRYNDIQTEVRLSNRYIGLVLGCEAILILVFYVLGKYAPKYELQQLVGFCLIIVFGMNWLANWARRLKKKIIFSFNDQLSIQIFDRNPERL